MKKEKSENIIQHPATNLVCLIFLATSLTNKNFYSIDKYKLLLGNTQLQSIKIKGFIFRGNYKTAPLYFMKWSNT